MTLNQKSMFEYIGEINLANLCMNTSSITEHSNFTK